MGSYLSVDAEKSLKDSIKDMGGLVNKSGLFLKSTSSSTVVNSVTGITRRSVSLIPRQRIAEQILEKLDQCKEMCLYACIMCNVKWLVHSHHGMQMLLVLTILLFQYVLAVI